MNKRAASELMDAYLARRGLSGIAREAVTGAVHLLFEERFRVSMFAAADECVWLRARIGDLPPPGVHRDRYVLEVGRLALVPALRADAACSIDPNEASIWLHTREPGSGTVETLISRMGDYLSELAFWRNAVKRIHY